MAAKTRLLTVRYDAAIIGAGANGLAAAAALAGAGLKVVVLERADGVGGRAATREFHPDFRASPWCDELAPVPPEIFRTLDLARHGAILVPAPGSQALWKDRRHDLPGWADKRAPLSRLNASAASFASEACARAFADAALSPQRSWFGSTPDPAQWPGEGWSHRSLAELLDETLASADDRALAMASALGGRTVDPFLPGSALYLVVPGIGGSGMVMGGLATFGEALAKAARAAGAEISLGLEVADIRHVKHRATGVRLADGTEIEASAVISTLDLRRTFFSLFAWSDLPKAAVERVTSYRQAASTARLLIALDTPPPDLSGGPVYVAPSAKNFADAAAAWQSGTVPEHPPMTLRLVSAADPRLAPAGKATMTATLGGIPHHLFDGPWTNEKRNALREKVLAEIEAVLPGIASHVLATDLIVPPDIEAALGVSEGDLDGGEIAPDQMFGARGFAEHPGGRTPVAGLYLGGRSSALGPLASCAAGIAAARALMADAK